MLLIQEPGQLPRSHSFREFCVVGRHPTNDVNLHERSASRHHLIVVRGSHGAYHIIDLGSTNGTWIDGDRIYRSSLRDNTEFVVGKARFRFLEPRLADQNSIGGEETLQESPRPSVSSRSHLPDLEPMYEIGTLLSNAGVSTEVFNNIVHLVLQATGARKPPEIGTGEDVTTEEFKDDEVTLPFGLEAPP